jgi:hypothetical protein
LIVVAQLERRLPALMLECPKVRNKTIVWGRWRDGIGKIAWKRSRPFIQRFTIGYALVCLILYVQQRLMFFPDRQLQHTTSQHEWAAKTIFQKPKNLAIVKPEKWKNWLVK